MDANKLIKHINQNKRIKNELFYIYVTEHLKKLESPYRTISISDDKIVFVGDEKIFQIDPAKTLAETIDLFEANMPEYEEHAKHICETLKTNTIILQDFCQELAIKLKKECFYLDKNINFVIEKEDRSPNQMFINVYLMLGDSKYSYDWKQFYYKDVYSNIQNVKLVIEQFTFNSIKKYGKNIILSVLSSIVSSTYDKVVFDDSYLIDKISYKKSFWKEDNKVTVSSKIIDDKMAYDKIKKQLEDHIFEIKCKEFIESAIKKYNIKKVNDKSECPNIFDLDNKKIYYEYGSDSKIVNELYMKLQRGFSKYKSLKDAKTLDEISEYEFLQNYYISKYIEKDIDGNHYVIYTAEDNNHRPAYVCFKNGIRNYDPVPKLLSYNNNIAINLKHLCSDKKYWDELSSLPLEIEQMDLARKSLNWSIITRKRPLSMEQLKLFHEYLDWEYILKNRKFKQAELEELVELEIISWDDISQYSINQHFLISHLDKINMDLVLKNPACKYVLDIAETLANSK